MEPYRFVCDGVEEWQTRDQFIPCRIGVRELRAQLFPQLALYVWFAGQFDENPLTEYVDTQLSKKDECQLRTARLTARF